MKIDRDLFSNYGISIIQGVSIGCAVAQGQQGQGSQFNSPCLQSFDQLFRKCFMDNGNFKLESIFSLVTNGSSGPLPPGTNKQQITQTVCG
jgi:hypothetical protein